MFQGIANLEQLAKLIGLAQTTHTAARKAWADRARDMIAELELELVGEASSCRQLESLKALLDAAEADIPALERFLKLPLGHQCMELGIELERIDFERTLDGWVVNGTAQAKAEDAAMMYFAGQGYVGTQCEGTAPLMLMKCASLEHLSRINTFGSREDAGLRFFEAQAALHPGSAAEICAQISRSTEKLVRTHFREIRGWPRYSALYPDINEDALAEIWTAFTPEGLARTAARFFSDPYAFRAGWPDMTLARGGALKFVEVKTNDKLHNSQRTTIARLLKPLGLDVSVLQLRRQR